MNQINKTDEIPTVEGKLDLEFLYNHTIKLVYYIIKRLVIDDGITQDLTQDTYISAFKNIGQLEGNTLDDFTQWVAKIATNKAKDYLKKKKPLLFSDYNDPDDDYEIEFEDDTTFDAPDLAYHKTEVSQIVESVMSELPEDQRLCVFLFYFEDYSINEISESLGVKENTVKSRLRIGREKIKDMIEDIQAEGTVLFNFAPFSIFLFGLTESVSDVKVPFSFNDIIKVGFASKIVNYIKKLFTKKSVVFATGALVTFSTLAFVLSNYNKPQEPILVDVFSDVSVQFEGYDGYGNATFSITGEEAWTEDLTFVFDKSSDLSNGDVIELKLTDITSEKDTNIEFLENSKKFVVSGLKEIIIVDITDYLDFNLSGFDGEGVLDMSFNYDNLNEELKMFLDGLEIRYTSTTGLSNGNSVKITIEESLNIIPYDLKEEVVFYEVFGLKSKPVVVESVDHEALILNRLEKYTNINFVREFLSQVEVDYYGNEIDSLDKENLTIETTVIKIGKQDNVFVSYVEMVLSSNGSDIYYGLTSYYSENIEAQSNLYGVSKDPVQKLDPFIEDSFENVEWLTIINR